MIHPTRIAAKIAARNRVNAEAKRLAPLMREALKPMIGKKIVNNGAVLSAKALALLPENKVCAANNTPELHWHYSCRGGYTLRVTFKVCELAKESTYNGAHYAETSIALADVEGGNLNYLKDASEEQGLRTDYTESEVRNWRSQLEEARKVVRELENNICTFGEYDQ